MSDGHGRVTAKGPERRAHVRLSGVFPVPPNAVCFLLSGWGGGRPGECASGPGGGNGLKQPACRMSYSPRLCPSHSPAAGWGAATDAECSEPFVGEAALLAVKEGRRGLNGEGRTDK